MEFAKWFVTMCNKYEEEPTNVAKSIGLSPASGSYWATGRSVPKAITLAKIEEHFGESFSERNTVESSLQRARDVDRVLFEVTSDMTTKEVEILTEFARTLKNANRGY